MTKNFFRASAEDFKKIPGSPVAYWVSEKMVKAFEGKPEVGSRFAFREGIHTANNGRFLRLWHEVSCKKFVVGASCYSDIDARGRWVPYNKGGEFRRWYGNNDYVIGFDCEYRNEMLLLKGHVWPSQDLYFREGGTWTAVTTGSFGVRYFPKGFLFDAGGQVVVGEKIIGCMAFLNSAIFDVIAKATMPTINYKCGVIKSLPDLILENNQIESNVSELISLSRSDWDEYETSWDFKENPLVYEKRQNENAPLKEVWESVLGRRMEWATQMRELEEENNRLFIEAYGLEDELKPDVAWKEVSITGNPFYRYKVECEGDEITSEGNADTLRLCASALEKHPNLEARLKSDTVKELISYAVGCMMGRYSLSKPGLILANQGSTIDDFRSQHQTLNSELSTPNLNFSPDADGIIPILDDDSFADDIVTQFHRFLRVAFGERNFNENLNFIEDALGKDIRAYFVKDFYPEHLTRYQKRPIYWLFSSPKGTFSALVYMHRYNAGTVGQVLGYLRSHITKIEARVDAADRMTADAAATQGMKSRAIKERAKLVRQLKELEDYEREIMHPLASKRIEIDLDDGVKVNYPKFGEALRKIPGMKKED